MQNAGGGSTASIRKDIQVGWQGRGSGGGGGGAVLPCAALCPAVLWVRGSAPSPATKDLWNAPLCHHAQAGMDYMGSSTAANKRMDARHR